MKKTKSIALPEPQQLINMVEDKQKTMKFDDFINNLNQDNDIKEKILKEVFKYLFDKDNLLMIARLDNTLAFYIIKHLIINNFYATYYFNVSYKIKILEFNKPPYYTREIIYHRPNEDVIIKNAYNIFISELLQVTISFKGEGRQELIKLYDALNERIRREETQGKQFLKNFGLAQ